MLQILKKQYTFEPPCLQQKINRNKTQKTK